MVHIQPSVRRVATMVLCEDSALHVGASGSASSRFGAQQRWSFADSNLRREEDWKAVEDKADLLLTSRTIERVALSFHLWHVCVHLHHTLRHGRSVPISPADRECTQSNSDYHMLVCSVHR